MDSAIDLRHAPRSRLGFPTAIVRGAEIEEVEMVDGSSEGIFVHLDAAPPVRSLIKLRIELAHRFLEAHAAVVRTVDLGDGLVGVGLRFFALNGQDRVFWESALGNMLKTSQVVPAFRLRVA